ncbi:MULTISPECIES: ABC transporter permease [unclassified Microbacterium]|uniref:ABC transporter permease n=1 Tax=unclassified Microbacterium TaxID=2609290 RepID=UPI001E2B2785|nr:ABC transporter permease [Microbacterium sp. Au-Mic1]MCE4025039.1 ABC transporter permease [Microbacterium sp. Au-Mic1]
MTRYLVRRLFFLLLSFVVGMLVVFLLLRVLPGDPANALISLNATPEQIRAAREQVGSDKPILVQLVAWLGGLLRGDLGTSFTSGAPVAADIAARLAVTLPLALISFVIATLLGAVIGVVAATRARRWYGVLLGAFTQLGIAVPVFWVGLLAVWLFALTLRLLPSGGFPRDDWADPVAALTSLALPILTIVVVMSASLARYVRSATLDVLDSDYLRTARALGESRTGAFVAHGVRNAAVPVISILGMELASTLLGAVVVESVFTLPGLGALLVKAVGEHDYPSIQGVLVVTTALVLVIGFVADVVQRLVDPRLRGSISARAAVA